MLRATLRALLARKLRLVLSGLAVVLGVAFVSGAFVLTDTLQHVFDTLFTDVNQGTDVTVQGKSALGGGSDNDREPVPQSVLDRVSKVPGVADAIGEQTGYAQVIDKKGKAYKTGGAPNFGVSMHPGSPQEALKVREGTAPTEPHQVAIDATTARKAHLAVGDHIKILVKGPVYPATLVGIVGLDIAPSFGGASLVAFDPTTAQAQLGTPGTWTALAIAAKPGVSQSELKKRVELVLPKGFEAQTQKQTIASQSKDLKAGLSGFNTFLLAFAGISLFVGAFIIFNTFSMLIAQRTRELALMRALGASRGQVTRSVLIEAVLVGLVASFVGFVVGVGIAVGLRKLLNALGIELPAGKTIIAPRTLIVSLIVGVVVTVVAALVPSRRAARVAPVQAMRDSGPAEDRSLVRRAIIGGVVLAAGIGALFAGLNGSGGIKVVGPGAALSFLGVATLSPLFARPVVGLLGWPLAKLGTPSSLGRGNAMRSPRRTSATAAALMIGLALVAMVDTLGASVKKSLSDYVGRSLGADYVLMADNQQKFSPELATILRKQPEFSQVAVYKFGKAKINGDTVDLQGVEAGPLAATLKVQTKTGDLTSIDRGGLAISETVASARGLKVGDKVDVVWSRTGDQPMRVGAVYKQNLFAGDYIVGDKTIDQNVTEQLVGVIALVAKDGVSPDVSRKAVDDAAKAFPNVDVRDQAQLIHAQKKQIDGLLNFLTILLVLSVLIAVLGIINTLALSVVERTRELGLLRAVGLSRRQMRRMIRAESVLIAIFGAVLGIVIGLCFGWALIRALSSQGIDKFAVPYQQLVYVLIAAAVAGVIAAALPARRAARLNVLDAIAAE